MIRVSTSGRAAAAAPPPMEHKAGRVPSCRPAHALRQCAAVERRAEPETARRACHERRMAAAGQRAARMRTPVKRISGDAPGRIGSRRRCALGAPGDFASARLRRRTDGRAESDDQRKNGEMLGACACAAPQPRAPPPEPPPQRGIMAPELLCTAFARAARRHPRTAV